MPQYGLLILLLWKIIPLKENQIEKADFDILKVRPTVLGWPSFYNFPTVLLSSFLVEYEFTFLTSLALILKSVDLQIVF